MININKDVEGQQSATLKEIKRNAEIYAISSLIHEEKLMLKDAAARLGISRQMLFRKMKKYGISQKAKK